MKEVAVVYPHQLFSDHPALKPVNTVYIVEEPLLLTHNPIHRQKLILHKLTMDAYEKKLRTDGYTTIRLSLTEHPETADVFRRLKQDGVERMHTVDTTDDYLERAIVRSGLDRVWYESPLFILEKQDAIHRFKQSKRFMATFYKQLRRDKHVLITDDGEPIGGAWSFDEENRQKVPSTTAIPEDIVFFGNQATTAATTWAEDIDAEIYGEPHCWLPYTHEGAETFLREFLEQRFHTFGPYEDAMTTRGVRLWHSTLSPLINIGLLTPQQVLDEAITYAESTDIPINSLEGFVRQILGWREFIRASYECDGAHMRQQNFFNHTRSLPHSFWDATTNLAPIDHTIQTALTYGYTHHIERLMVMGNFMLLSQIDPDDVYAWFMGMYLDAYDWVMVPNVYGMSQFADGGSFTTKPYISGANYIKKMSDYSSGDWEEIWTALYWNFIATHRTVFEKNHRLSMMPRMLDRMNDETKKKHVTIANAYLAN